MQLLITQIKRLLVLTLLCLPTLSIAQDLFRNGKGKTIKSQRTGLWEFFHDNGELSAKGIYINGLKDGKWDMYYENGNLKFVGYYRNGFLIGDFKEYYPDGQPKEKLADQQSVEIEPLPPGGSLNAFKNWIAKSYIIPPKAKKAKVNGTIIASFVVERNGNIEQVHIVGDLGYGTGEELERVLLLSEKWQPGIVNGKSVRVQYQIPLKISIP